MIARAIVVAGAMTVGLVAVPPAATAAPPCLDISPLDCADVAVEAPIQLEFDGSGGGLTDNAATPTGFTMADPPSSPLAPPSDPSVPGHESSGLDVDTAEGVLRVTTAPGIAYRTPAQSSGTNSQVNALGVGLSGQAGEIVVSTTLEPLDFGQSPGNGYQQAGLWLGTGEDDYAKLVLLKASDTTAQVQLLVESGGGADGNVNQPPPDLLTAPFPYDGGGASAAPVVLTMRADLDTGEVSASYDAGGGEVALVEGTASALSLPPTWDTGTSPEPFAGILATHRFASTPLVVGFDEFSVTSAGATTPPTPDPEVDEDPPPAPADLQAAVAGDTVTLLWEAVTDASGIDRYEVHRSTDPAFEPSSATLALEVDGAQSSADDGGVADGLWYYRVLAVDGAGNSGFPSAAEPASVFPAGTLAFVSDTAVARLSAEVDQLATSTLQIVQSEGDAVPFAVSDNAEWLEVTGPLTTPTELQLIADGSGLEAGVYTADLTVRSSGYPDLVIPVRLTVTSPPPPFTLDVNFQPAGASVPAGYLRDSGQAFGLRTSSDQGSGAYSYGWVSVASGSPLSLEGNARDRNRPGLPDQRLDTLIHMQYGDTGGSSGVAAAGAWEVALADGVYSVEVTVGDQPWGGVYDSVHAINVEGAVAVEAVQASPNNEYPTSTVTVAVDDGHLTLTPIGGTNTKLTYVRVTEVVGVPHVTDVNPLNRASGVGRTDGVAADIRVPGAGVGVDPATLEDNVRLVDITSGQDVPSTVGSSGGNDVITLSPDEPLSALTSYRFEVTDGVLSERGDSFAPFTSVFTTGSVIGTPPETGDFTPLTGVGFTKVVQPVAAGDYIASMVFGPDGRLYTTTIGAGIYRYDVDEDGTLSNKTAVGPPDLLGRAVIGLVFDENATPDSLGAYITHASGDLANEQAEWGSKISHLSGPDLDVMRDVFVDLPRSLKDHLTNSIAYGPTGTLLVLQGSNQAAGDFDLSWGDRGEKLLSAALLEFDPAHPDVQAAIAGTGPAISVRTSGVANPYDPFDPSSPLSIYASGIRNAYDLVSTRDGYIFVPTNGTAGGGNSPGVDVIPDTGPLVEARRIGQLQADYAAACTDRRIDGAEYAGGDVPAVTNHGTQPDHLYLVEEGGYYGHPNPERCEWVLHSGNPTGALDPFERPQGSDYPVGVQPDPNYRGYVHSFGYNKSPNGVIEYTGDAFGGQLDGWLVVTRFSNNNDLLFLEVDKQTGAILGTQSQTGVTGVPGSAIPGVGGFDDPLDVVQDPSTGNLYVNQYDRGGTSPSVYLLRVSEGEETDAISVNFQPSSVAVPSGWVADTGEAYDDTRGFGWTAGDRSSATRNRPAPAGDPLLKTLTHLQGSVVGGGDGVWEYAVPAGVYDVEVSVGDGSYADSVHAVDVEGVPVVESFVPSGAGDFQQTAVRVTVLDGAVTVQAGATGVNTKLNWVRIIPVGPPPPPPTVEDGIDVNFQPSSVAVPSGWVADTGEAYNDTRGFGWTAGDRSSATRNRPAPAGDPLLKTLTHLQGSVVGGGDGVWEYAVPAGVYDVEVSVGDGSYADSVHAVDVEGVPVVESFVPSGAGDFQQAKARVAVADGRLTLSAGSTGVNTKVNWITFVAVDPSTDDEPPVVTLDVSGPEVASGEYGGQAVVTVDATDDLAGVEFLEYSVNGSAPQAYDSPIVLDELGVYTVEATAVDANGNAATESVTLTVVEPGDATVSIINEDATRRDGAPVGGFFDDWLVMSRINGGLDTTPPAFHQFHDTATVTIANTGGGNPLRVSRLEISPLGEFVIDNAPQLPLEIPAGDSETITVTFTATGGVKGVRSAELIIGTSDATTPETVVQLRGVWQAQPEGSAEVDLRDIVDAFGYATDMGSGPIADENSSPLVGEEVRSKLWVRADPSSPVVARQLAAYHGCFSSDTLSLAGSSVSHAGNYCQSLLPPAAGGSPATELEVSPGSAFPIVAAGYSTNTTGNLGIRTWPVRSPDGALVPNTWLVVQDFVAGGCGQGAANCDYNDNIYVVSNVLPASPSGQAPPPPANLSGELVDGEVVLDWDDATTDVLGYRVERAPAGSQDWTRLTDVPLTDSDFTDSSPTSGGVAYRVVALNLTGLESGPSDAVVLDTPGGDPTPSQPPTAEPEPAPTLFSYTPLAEQPVPVSEAQGLVIGDTLYQFGGFDSQKSGFTPTERSYAFSIPNQTWTPLADMPFLAGNGQPGTGVTHAGVTTDGANIYLAGGFVSADGENGQKFGTKEVYRYSIADDAYTRLPDLPEERSSGSLVYLDGRLHFISGSNTARTTEPTDHYVLDLSGGATAWASAAPLPEGRNHPSAVASGGLIYFIAGQTGHDGPSVAHADVWSYDPATDAWTARAPIPQAVNHAVSATFVLGDRIVVAGGKTTHTTFTDKVWAYDPGTDTWDELSPLPTARGGGVAGPYAEGFVYTGGFGADAGAKGVRATPTP